MNAEKLVDGHYLVLKFMRTIILYLYYIYSILLKRS